jgi:opacity protein-like surface antigen
MRPIHLTTCLLAALCTVPAQAQESVYAEGRWNFRFDMGGNMPADPKLTEFSGPITQGGEMELTAGAQFGMAIGYRVTPWLTLEGEMVGAFNNVDSIGNWSYYDSTLSHLLFMVNAVVEKPIGRFVPFAGVGVGGDLSYLTFGNDNYYYWYWEPDGEGSDFVFCYQAFGGIRYQFDPNCSLGVMYRYFATQAQEWDVEWWNGPDFKVGVDAIGVHCVSLVFNVSF